MLTVLVICLPAFLPAPPVGRVRLGLGGIPLAGVSVLERSSRSAVVMADDPEAVAKAAAAAAKAAAAKAATATKEKLADKEEEGEDAEAAAAAAEAEKAKKEAEAKAKAEKAAAAKAAAEKKAAEVKAAAVAVFADEELVLLKNIATVQERIDLLTERGVPEASVKAALAECAIEPVSYRLAGRWPAMLPSPLPSQSRDAPLLSWQARQVGPHHRAQLGGVLPSRQAAAVRRLRSAARWPNRQAASRPDLLGTATTRTSTRAHGLALELVRAAPRLSSHERTTMKEGCLEKDARSQESS